MRGIGWSSKNFSGYEFRLKNIALHFCCDWSRVVPPGASLTYFNDGGGPEVHILYPQKIPTSEFVYQKKSLLVLAYPKKSLLAKMSDPKKSFGPPPSLKYVSGAPGVVPNRNDQSLTSS